MSEGVLIALIGVLATPVAVFITWMTNRKKHVADIYNVLTASSQSAVETMQAAMETLHEELDSALKKIDMLQAELELLRQQNNKLLTENTELHKKVDELVSRFTEN